jgi:predicted NBD/HSP70 family sugar kinase
MKRVTAITKIRTANQRALLHLIHENKTISRVQLARKLHVSKSTVTNSISPLLERGVVLETGTESSQNTGRRSVLLCINSSYRFVIAIDVCNHSPIIVLADLNGNIISRHTFPLAEDVAYPLRKHLLFMGINNLLENAGLSSKNIVFIALSSPGAYSAFLDTYQLNAEYKNWRPEKLKNDLSSAFAVKVVREKNVNASVLGEFFNGKWKNTRNLMFFSVGVGVGMGMILDGKLYTGTSGSAGEIARICFSPPGEPLRSIVEINALVKRLRNELPKKTLASHGYSGPDLDFEGVVKLWEAHEPLTRSCVADIGGTIGRVIALLLSILNCELVIFGGDYLVFKEQLLPVINRIVQEQAFDPVEVVASSLEQDASLQGLISITCNSALDYIAKGRL